MNKILFNISFFILYFLNIGNVHSNQSLPVPDTWNNELKNQLFEDIILEDGKDLFSLVTPYRADDAAMVPISINFNSNQDPDLYAKSISIIIDENPSPLAATFVMTQNSGLADLSTRIRVDRYSFVRAVVEYSNGKNYMVSNYVKASGGCSAPSLGDMDSIMARLGKMKMKFLKTGFEDIHKAQFIISHPNFSGLQFNQLTRTEIPAHFIDKILISQNGEPIIEIQSDISISEDPSVTFHYSNNGGDLEILATDTDGQVFKKNWPVNEIMTSSN